MVFSLNVGTFLEVGEIGGMFTPNCSGKQKGAAFQHHGQLPVAPGSFQHLLSHRFQN